MLAVVGAAAKLRSAGKVDAAIQEQIERGARMVLGDAAADLQMSDGATILTMIGMALAEAGELFRDPARTAGWQVQAPELLQVMGRASSHAFDRIFALAETRPLLRDALAGTFLDVGTGVGGIALRAADACPELRIDAIDIWEPALRLAAENIAASLHADRIRLRNLDVTALEPELRYTLAWLPTMFMNRAVVEAATARIAAATRSGGWLVAALYTTPDDPFGGIMASLRTLRGGGEITDPMELRELLRADGYVDVEVEVAPLATFVFGRRG
ncbi:methyltransferase domain-containing protein [Croceibacterium ferulae]|uniref:methyltransferase domain-containing protein n=1 Tax=Croceibacterium ferulae TaxID=1854641 RepID=UPI001390200D|nr:methyltransferase domain-containing protein [Croceibacterium ferulae]